MSGNGGEEAPRPRPLSGGLWTLFSWLRRDERATSSDSLSSAGSDRTALSFAFLPPVNYSNGVVPLVVPPPGPPTDSYRKRVQERNLRRQHDRNITLHRKYGLYRTECPNGYDALSLPPVRRINADSNCKWDRERRATSECFQSRVVHVPGKRRAPLPPTRATSVGPSTTLIRRTRKRPAPQPPVKLLEKIEEINLQSNKNTVLEMNPETSEDLTKTSDISMGCKPEKYSKKDSNNTKENKVRSEKSFLKQIFENKKRNSTMETASVKVLPSISELDKQAAEIIKTNKQNSVEGNTNITSLNLSNRKSQKLNELSKREYWFCITCLRKYDSSIADCLYCLQKQNSRPSNLHVPGLSKNVSLTGATTQTDNALSEKTSSCRINQECKPEDKQKLKEMLKEMKDSLPKKLKCGINESDTTKNKNSSMEIGDKTKLVFETPTLRIGAIINTESNTQSTKENNLARKESAQAETKTGASNIVFITKQVVIEASASKPNKHVSGEGESKANSSNCNFSGLSQSKNLKELTSNSIIENKDVQKLNTPLKISSLLNPIYIPKDNNNMGSSSSENGLLDTKIMKTKINKEKTVAKVELINEQHTVLNNFTAITPSTTQVFQVKPLQQNSKLNQYLPEKQLHHKGGQNINKSSTQVCEQNILKNKPVEKGELVNIDASVSDKILLIADKTGTDQNTANNSPITNSSKEKQVGVLRKSNTSSNDFTYLDKTSQNTGLNKDTKLPPIAEIGKTSESKTVCVEKTDMNNTKSRSDVNLLKITPSSSNSPIIETGHHFQRRSLINQLEQSIAKGDERAAAEAAAKLAQLRLSCSVLSFSSQIISEPQSSSKAKNIGSFVPDGASPNKLNSNSSLSQTKVEFIENPTNKISNIVAFASTAEISPPINKSLPTNTTGTLESTQKSVLQSAASKQHNDLVALKVWVEDRESARGPIHLRVHRQATMGNLRNEAEASLGLARHLQRWIVGRTLCTDDNALLVNVAGADFAAPIYLCLVESELNKHKTQEKTENITEIRTPEEKKENGVEDVINVYTELVQLEQQALVPNTEAFECGICMEETARGQGAVLRDCVHTFCKQCLSDLVLHCEEPIISCPAMGCRGILEEREIRALVSPEEYERWLARGLNAAESGTRNAFHCRTRDCTGWALCDPGVQRFPCPVCKHTNCVPCQAIHEGQTCEDYKTKLKESTNSAEGNQTDDDTRALLNTLIKRGEALECPECKAIITKKWGCDWIKCSACKTEICWVTRGRRWGPAGRGDTSAGCRCGLDGKRCHPSCGYCH